MKQKISTWPAKFVAGITDETDCLSLNQKLQKNSSPGFSIQTRHFSIQIQMLHFTLNNQDFWVNGHTHRFIELAFPLRNMQYQIGNEHRLTPFLLYNSGLLLIPPDVLHSRKALKDSSLCFSVVFDLQADSDTLLRSFYHEARRRKWCMNVSPKMHRVLTEIAHDLSIEDEFSGNVQFILFNRFLIELMRENFPFFFRSFPAKNSASLPETVRIFLENNLSSPNIMEDISKTFCFSTRHLNRVFKNTYGLSIKQWVIRERIRTAAQRLLASDDPIKVIADSCGFANMSYFTRQFNKAYNTNPSDYRKIG